MSIPTLQGLQTALSGLIAEQTALDTTGNNIDNANTEGYSRETAILEPNPPLVIPAISARTGEGAQLGTGVSVATITRIRNDYLDAQYRTQNSALSGATTQSEVLEQAQSAFNEPSSAGIASQLSAFWTAWNDLADSPTSEAAKEAVVAAGKQLATTFNELSAQLSTISKQTTEQYEALTAPSGEVANYANQIAQLNGQIKLAEEAHQQPNDMLDRRDLLLDKLSALANITVTEQPDHTDTVSFGEAAKPLVEGTTVNWPQALTEAAGGRLGALLGLTGPKGALTRPADGTGRRGRNAREHRQRTSRKTVLLRRNRRDPRRGGEILRSPGLLDQIPRGQRSGSGNRGAARRRGRTGLRGARREGGRRRTDGKGRTRPTSRPRSRRSTTSARASRASRSMKK